MCRLTQCNDEPEEKEKHPKEAEEDPEPFNRRMAETSLTNFHPRSILYDVVVRLDVDVLLVSTTTDFRHCGSRFFCVTECIRHVCLQQGRLALLDLR